jgi:hypothetical protein
MRTRLVGIAAFAVGALLAGPALPASAQTVSSPDLKALANTIDRARDSTYDAQYISVTNGQRATVIVAQEPPKSVFSSSGSSIIDDGKTTYFCSASPSATSNTGNTGTTTNTGSTGSGSTTTASSSGPQQCVAEQGTNPLLGLQDIFSPRVALGALAEAKQGLGATADGIKVSSSSATIAGQPSTCIAVTVQGKGGKYCVTKQGILSYAGSSSSDYFRLTKFSAKPPAGLFTLPAGATTSTVPGSGATS